MKLTATLGTASFVLEQVEGPASFAGRSPLPALPQPSGLLFGVHPELLGVAPIHLKSSTVRALAKLFKVHTHFTHPTNKQKQENIYFSFDNKTTRLLILHLLYLSNMNWGGERNRWTHGLKAFTRRMHFLQAHKFLNCWWGMSIFTQNENITLWKSEPYIYIFLYQGQFFWAFTLRTKASTNIVGWNKRHIHLPLQSKNLHGKSHLCFERNSRL